MAEVLYGHKSIAAHLGVLAEETVIEWASLAWDPLPLRISGGVVNGWSPHLDDWLERRRDLAAWRASGRRGDPGLPVVVAHEEIAKRINGGVSVDTVQRATEARPDCRPLPIHGVDHTGLLTRWTSTADRLDRGDGAHRVWIYATALRDWNDWRDRPYERGQARPRSGSGLIRPVGQHSGQFLRSPSRPL